MLTSTHRAAYVCWKCQTRLPKNSLQSLSQLGPSSSSSSSSSNASRKRWQSTSSEVNEKDGQAPDRNEQTINIVRIPYGPRVRHHRAEVRAEKLQSRRLGQPAEILVLPIKSRRDGNGGKRPGAVVEDEKTAGIADGTPQSHILEALEKERKPLLKEELDNNINSVRNGLSLHDGAVDSESLKTAQKSLVKGFTLQQLKGYLSRHAQSSITDYADASRRLRKLDTSSPKDRAAAQIIYDVWGITSGGDEEASLDGSYQRSNTFNPRKLDLLLLEDPHLLNNLSQSFGVTIDVFESDRKITFAGSQSQITDASNAFNETLARKLSHKPVVLPASIRRHLASITPITSPDISDRIVEDELLNDQLLELRRLMQSHQVLVDAITPGEAWSFDPENLRSFVADVRALFPSIQQTAVPEKEPADATEASTLNNQDQPEELRDVTIEELPSAVNESATPRAAKKGVLNTILGCSSSLPLEDTIRQPRFLPGASKSLVVEWSRFVAKSPSSTAELTHSASLEHIKRIQRRLAASFASNLPVQAVPQSIMGVYTEYTAELGHAVHRIDVRQKHTNLLLLLLTPFVPQYLNTHMPLPDSDDMSLSTIGKDTRLIRLRFKGPKEVVQPPLEVLMSISPSLTIAVESIHFEVGKGSCYFLLPNHYTDLRFTRRDKLTVFTKGKPISDVFKPVLADLSGYLESSVQTGREDFYHKTFHVNVDLSSLGHEGGGSTRMQYLLDRAEELDIKRYSVVSSNQNQPDTTHAASNLVLDHSSFATVGYNSKQWQQSLKIIDAGQPRPTQQETLDGKAHNDAAADENDQHQSEARLTNLITSSFDIARNLDRFIRQKEKELLAGRSKSST